MNLNKTLSPKLTKAQIFKEDMWRCRGVDFIELGMTVEINGDRGKVVGMNMSANLDVRFDDTAKYGKRVCNCHPFWKAKYFNKDNVCIE